MTEIISAKNYNYLFNCLLCTSVLLLSPAVAFAQEVEIDGAKLQATELATVEINKLLPKPYRVEFPLVTRSGRDYPSPSTCAEWNALSRKQRDGISLDKFTQIYVTNIKNICWLVDKLSQAQRAQIVIGSVDDMQSEAHYPAGLIYSGFWRGREYVKNGQISPPNVNDLTLEISSFFKTDTEAIRKLIWGKRQVSLSTLALEVFAPSMSMITPKVSLGINRDDRSIEGQFLRTSFRTSVVLTGMDVNGDQTM